MGQTHNETIYPLTPETLNSLPGRDVYFLGFQHGGFTDSPSIDQRVADDFDFKGVGLRPIPETMLVVGASVYAHGKTRYIVQKMNEYRTNPLSGSPTLPKAELAEREFALGLLKLGYVVETQIMQREDTSYVVQIRVQTQNGGPKNFGPISELIKKIGVKESDLRKH